MMLETDSKNRRFKVRMLEGVNSDHAQNEPTALILDGQQRLTALFQSLMSGKPVSTLNSGGDEVLRWYYIDMEQCIKVDGDRETAIISRRTDGQLRKHPGEIIHLSSIEKEYAHSIFPVHKIFHFTDWQGGYHKYWNFTPDKVKLFNKFKSEVIECFRLYKVPIIKLHKETSKKAVCTIFRKVNTERAALTDFELLTAFFAIDDYQLRENWDKRSKRMKKHPVLASLDGTDFLRALTLLTTNANRSNTAPSCTRRDILELKVKDDKRWADITEDGFIQAAKFLSDQKIFRAKDLPYQTQLIALAAIFGGVKSAFESAYKLLEEAPEEHVETAIKEEVRKASMAQLDRDQKISRWYWCGVFGEMYAGAANTQIANDFSEMTSWLREETDLPSTVRDANFSQNRLLEVQSRASAVYKGVYALLIPNKCLDFRTGVPIDEKIFFDDDIDIHHIFPKAWCENQNIESNVFNNIVNKTALSATTNRKIGGQAPSDYLLRIQEEAGINSNQMDEILDSHLIFGDALREDNFDKFFDLRKEALLEVIEKVMGKKVVREPDEPVIFDIEALLNGPDAQH